MAFTLDIVTPERTIYSGSVESLQAPGSQGSFGVLARHAPMIAAMKVGALGFVEEGSKEPRSLACSGGFVEVGGDRVTVLAEAAEFGDEIDRARAAAARERAQERLNQRDGVDAARAEVALARALNRLHIAGGD
jgi:F-type H+-transporting ATPase subunit epsilon